ncbi:tetratricopeptide repeat protein [Seonamhaeicola sp.]|uniref:tetratricopeptide repeat-containing sensor histidine kinase n=1 Tax=Seonamhaeicola sp. TaxID=1912245 RepID=UPI002635D57D|nr:tetratricopeptide repeat protein [Seonamhaeicola sp.]
MIIDSLKIITQTTGNDSIKATAYGKLGWLTINRDVERAKAYVDSSYALFQKLNDQNGMAVNDYRYGVINRVSGNYASALESMDKYLTYAEIKSDSFNLANGYYQKGVIYSLQGDYERSLKEYHKALNIYEAQNNATGIGFTLNSLGIVYKNLKKYPEAIESYQRAVKIHEKNEDLNNLANVYNSIGAVYAEQNKSDLALEYYNKTLAIDIEIQNNWGTAKVSKNIALIHIDKKKYNEALKFLNNALEIQKQHNYSSEIAETLAQLSKAYMELGDLDQSESLIKQVSQHKIPSKKVHQDVHLQAFSLYDKLGNTRQALYHHKKYTVYKDSIFNENNIKNINTLQVQYETEKKDKALLQQQLQIEQNENALRKKKTQYNYMTGIAIFFLLSVLLTWLIYRQRQKRKDQEILTLKREHQIKTLETLIEGEEKERLRIAKELHDGVNGDLSAIKFKLVSLQEMNNRVINEAVEMIDKSCQQVRAISHNLIPPSLESFSLVEAIDMFCQNINNSYDIKVDFHFIGNSINLRKKEEVNIFRIIQELVSNSIKHAEASEINVQMSHREQSIFIIVEDDGKGFDFNNVKSEGIGLMNLRSRVEFLQAEMDVISNDKGTSFTIEIDTQKLE